MRGRSHESMSWPLDANLVPFFICPCDDFISLNLFGRSAARDEGDTMPSSPSVAVSMHLIPLSAQISTSDQTLSISAVSSD